MENEWEGPYSVIEKCDETTYKLNMPDHPRRQVKRHVNLLREFVSLTARCMLVHTESELDFGPSIVEGKKSRLKISDRLTNEEKKQIDQLMTEFGRLMLGQPVDDAVRELLELGIVRPSRSPWASPALLVAKHDGINRFCVDFQKLNSITISDPFPLPLIGQLLDLLKGYHQVPMQADSIPKTAFITS